MDIYKHKRILLTYIQTLKGNISEAAQLKISLKYFSLGKFEYLIFGGFFFRQSKIISWQLKKKSKFKYTDFGN